MWDEINTRLIFVKKMFFITNVVNPQVMVLRSKYQALAAEQIKIVDDFIISTLYRKKIESIIFDAFLYSFFTGELVCAEQLYRILVKEHPSSKLNPSMNNDMFLNALQMFESQRIIIS